MSGETPWQAVIREVQEEVGLVVAVDRLLGIYAYPPKDDLVFSFLCTHIGGEIVESNEAGLLPCEDSIGKVNISKQMRYTTAKHEKGDVTCEDDLIAESSN